MLLYSGANLRDVRRLAKGPSKNWTDNEKNNVVDFYAWLRKNKAKGKISVKKGYRHEIILPVEEELFPINSYESMSGIVWMVGGADSKVHLKIGSDKPLVCDANQDLAEELGKKLYHKVRLSLKVTRAPEDMRIIKNEIISIEQDMGHKIQWEDDRVLGRQYESIKKIQKILSSELKNFDAEKFINEIRNG